MFAELSGQEMLPALQMGDGCHGIVSLSTLSQAL
jgi:hypothetical protein